MSSDFAIRLRGVSKCYAVYERPEDRLLQYFLPWMVGILPKFLQSVLPERIRRPRHFREFWSLHGVTLDVRRGESVGIIGMNGAGKSTLLQLVAGILAPTSGEVEVNGRIAGLFELGSGFNPDFTGRENVLLNGAILGFNRAEIEAKMQEILDFAAIGDFVDQPVKTYSSGMVVRLAFAVQVQLEPDILIVDEALAVGDALFQKRCFSRIEKFLANGGTLLFVSHDQETVRTLTDRAVLLRHGRVERVGTSSEVVLEYRRLLHEEENRYARVMLQSLSRQAGSGEAGLGPTARVANTSVEGPRELSRSSLMAFGDLDVEVVSTTVHDGAGNICDLFYPGDVIRVRIGYEARHEATHLNLGLRLRNKEGVKIYSAGTFNDDLATSQEAGTTWSRTFRAGEHFVLEMEFPCILGEGFYEIQAYVTEEEVFAPGHQRTLHWVDEAAFFRVSMNRFSRWYGGVCDLAPRNRVLANGA